MTLNIFDTQQEALEMLARYFVQLANEAIEDRDRFTVALSGGHTPEALYILLAGDYRQKVSAWNKVYFFFGDERYVPHTDAASNYRMAKATLLDPLNIPADHIFPVDTTLTPEAAALAYQQQIDDFFLSHEIRMDLILLGLGDNAHTASLFPYTDVLNETDAGVSAVWTGDSGWRITLNAPLINQARNIAFLVFGEEKAEAMQHTFSKEINTAHYPAQLIRKERIAWFTDKSAAARVQQG
ncbi:6-phosphogluconolactonase [Taibaiella helva]|uniref:6-phosphogluconolactonase n=1 Tax=Taibaiella helva TaxID=2301235 RepID=UPI000E59252A|nr:6-phosphogluconolactonase [Taibaiella helva]